jgi:hypothetical protein
MYNVINNVEVKRRRPIWLDQLHTYKHNRCLTQLQQMNGVNKKAALGAAFTFVLVF